MRTLVIDRSTANTSVVLVKEDGAIEDLNLGIWSSDADILHSSFFILHSHDDSRLARIVVGVGPGSFAGIRSVLAFAQGYALGAPGVEVLGIVSAAAFAEAGRPVAVVGDARRGLFWIALFDGYRLVTDVFQVEREGLASRIPRGVPVVSPDDARIGAALREVFGEAYAPAPKLSAAALVRAFTANPALLRPEPLPLYLNPAVR